MALEDNDEAWCMQDAAYELRSLLEAMAEEVRL